MVTDIKCLRTYRTKNRYVTLLNKRYQAMRAEDMQAECYNEVSISTCRQRIYEYVYTRYKEVA